MGDNTNAGATVSRTLQHARGEAKRYGSRTVEAEHLLLALASDADGPVGGLLAKAGLDHERLLAALREENRQSLAFAGVRPLNEERARATRLASTPLWGASAKRAISHGHRFAIDHRRRRESTRDLLAGILQAELGTVPRALAILGVDRAELVSQIGPGAA